MRRRYPQYRFVTFAMLLAVVMSALLVRLAWIQVLSMDKWQRIAESQSSLRLTVKPRRGAIFDRHGHPLALTEQRYRVGVTDPGHWRQPGPLLRLADLLDTSERSLRSRLRGRQGHVVLEREATLSPEDYDILAGEPTITLEGVYRRTYPMEDLAINLLGRVADHGRGDAGLERAYDDVLAGTEGLELVRFDGSRRRDTLVRQPLEPPVPGQDLVLTLDVQVQMILEEEIEAARAVAGATDALGIVLEPTTGEVVALAETPAWRATEEDADRWRCRAATEVFEPGSTFKLFTVASLLSHAVCDTATRFDGEGRRDDRRSSANLGGFVFHDVHPVGVVSLRHAFAVSSNIVMGKAVKFLQPKELYGSLTRYGFGSKTGSGWPAETPGLLNEVDQWSRRTPSTLAIGQEIGVSLLQLTAGFAALVTDGNLRTPRLVRTWYDEETGRAVPPPSNVTRRGIVPPSLIPTLRALCREVVARDYGSGTLARIEGFDVGGKTGTGQISTDRGYLPDRFTASFVGFIPVDNPRLLTAIVLRGARGQMKWGGYSAAPCFRRVMQKVIASTEWLDAWTADDAVDPAANGVEIPDLVGRTPEDVRTLAEAGRWDLRSQPPGASARVVGQMPPPGTRATPGTRIHLAWAKGGP